MTFLINIIERRLLKRNQSSIHRKSHLCEMNPMHSTEFYYSSDYAYCIYNRWHYISTDQSIAVWKRENLLLQLRLVVMLCLKSSELFRNEPDGSNKDYVTQADNAVGLKCSNLYLPINHADHLGK